VSQWMVVRLRSGVWALGRSSDGEEYRTVIGGFASRREAFGWLREYLLARAVLRRQDRIRRELILAQMTPHGRLA
jgi:hypothetical protein